MPSRPLGSPLGSPLLLLLALTWTGAVMRMPISVIPPPWADPVANPCSARSWQLVRWPLDGRCYQLFRQGPCPPTQELVFDPSSKRPRCRCPPKTLLWPPDQTCHPRFSRGQCPEGQYMDGRRSSMSGSVRGSCRLPPPCPPGQGFWPGPGAACQPILTRGPCTRGDLLVPDPESGTLRCRCPPEMRRHLWPPAGVSGAASSGCFQHFTRGPCERGELFFFRDDDQRTACGCRPNFPGFHPQSEMCFEEGSQGPCKGGKRFRPPSSRGRGKVPPPSPDEEFCRCPEGFVSLPGEDPDGSCHPLFSRGPCRPGQFLVPDSNQTGSESGRCMPNPCPRGHLFMGPDFPDSPNLERRCHRPGEAGSCPKGQVVTGFHLHPPGANSGSLGGRCGCDRSDSRTFHPESGMCFQLGTRGPCPPGQVLAGEESRPGRPLVCQCDQKGGFVEFPSAGSSGGSDSGSHLTSSIDSEGLGNDRKCFRLKERGPCEEGHWVVMDQSGRPQCTCMPGFRPGDDGSCTPASVRIAKFLTLNNPQR